jgi:hypothetical protein
MARDANTPTADEASVSHPVASSAGRQMVAAGLVTLPFNDGWKPPLSDTFFPPSKSCTVKECGTPEEEPCFHRRCGRPGAGE